MNRLIRPVVIEGGLSQDRLNQLRDRLGLSKRGRLDDSEDVDFGSHMLSEGEGSGMWLSLRRDDASGWPGGYCADPIFKFELTAVDEPPSVERIDYWRSQILQAIEDAGLQVAYRSLEPGDRLQSRSRKQNQDAQEARHGAGASAGSEEMRGEDTVLSLLQHLPALAPLTQDIMSWFKYAIYMQARPTDPATELPTGSSKLGGLPDLPSDVAWPEWNGLPLPFLAQIRLSDLIPYDQSNQLPHTGMLSFFFRDLDLCNGSDLRRESWQVLFTQGKLTDLQRRQASPKSQSRYFPGSAPLPVCSLEFFTRPTLPPFESRPLQEVGLSYDVFQRRSSFDQRQQAKAYLALGDQLNRLSRLAHPVHQLVGYPDQLQGDLQEACQERTRGRSRRTDWQLLLQLDTDLNAGMRWGDEGLLYFYIPRLALEARDFSQVCLLFQCY